ncbi:MAG: DUF3368 domain-containing protein [gamma proteobacterium symbiont of Taylorina sp.]|nr:DUF3368 domain-containing protein [gamma proteobacterium symbiont of Taylorina sp.]
MTKTSSIDLVIADTSPLIVIAIMDLFPVLNQLFERVLVPDAVVDECLNDLSKPHSLAIKQALKDKIIEQKKISDIEFCQLLGQVLDPGEAEAISLTKDLDAIALIDEKSGRKIAKREGVDCIGSFYILIKAKQNGFIVSVAPLLKCLLDHGYYLNSALIDTVLIACNEMNDESKSLLSYCENN